MSNDDINKVIIKLKSTASKRYALKKYFNIEFASLLFLFSIKIGLTFYLDEKSADTAKNTTMNNTIMRNVTQKTQAESAENALYAGGFLNAAGGPGTILGVILHSCAIELT